MARGAALVAAGACVHPPAVRSPQKPVEFVRSLTLYDHPLDLHLARPAQLQPGMPLLFYATGDGGWRGKDLETYRHLIRWGYPVAGFSAPSYLSHLGFVSGTTTPARLARDYQRLIEFAKQTLNLPASTRTVLVGVSRGAGLAVVAAGRRELNVELAGVLAVALTKEEEYVRQYRVKPGLTGRHADAGTGRVPDVRISGPAAGRAARRHPVHRRQLPARGVGTQAVRPRHRRFAGSSHRSAGPQFRRRARGAVRADGRRAHLDVDEAAVAGDAAEVNQQDQP